MNTRHFGAAALVAILLSFSTMAQAEVVRAFWAGSVSDAVDGNAYELAIGAKLLATMDFDTQWLESFAGFAPAEPMEVAASFYTRSPTILLADHQSSLTPIFDGQIRFLDSMVWQAIDAGEIIATGTWSVESIRFEQRVVPVPAALPLLLGAIGVLMGMQRRS